jgi:hypothetical protein
MNKREKKRKFKEILSSEKKKNHRNTNFSKVERKIIFGTASMGTSMG